MHPYASEARPRKWIYLLLTLAAVLSAWTLQQAMRAIPIATPWWFELPSVLGFFGAYWKLFDDRVWSWGLLRRIGLVAVPDLRGVWNAQVSTSHKGNPHRVRGRIQIEQTWTKLCVLASWPESESHSVSAALQRGPRLRLELTYTFVNEPKAQSASTMEMHRGTAWLRIDNDGTEMEGQYYSGRGRQQVGHLTLRRGTST